IRHIRSCYSILETAASVDRAQELLHLGRTRMSRVRLRPGPLDGRRGDLAQLVLRHTEVAQPLEAAEPGELLDTGGRIARLERLAEAAHGFRCGLCVESQRRGQGERVHRTVREAVAAAERLCDRVAQTEHRAAERHPRIHCGLEQLRASLEVAR